MQVSLRQLLVTVLIVSLSVGAAVNTLRYVRLRWEFDLQLAENRRLEADVQKGRDSALVNENFLNSSQLIRDAAATILVPGPRASRASK